MHGIQLPRDDSNTSPRILIGHGDPTANLNLGDIAMVANVVAKIRKRVRDAQIRLIGIEPPPHWRIPEVEYVPELVSPFEAAGSLWSERLITGLAKLPSVRGRPRCAIRRMVASAQSSVTANVPSLLRRTNRLRPVFEQLYWADVLVEAGHGGFNDLWYEPIIAAKTFLIKLARKLNIPVILSGHGYGPISNGVVLKELRRAIDGVDFLGVRSREEMTAATLQDLNLRRVTPCYSGDDACDLENASDQDIDRILQASRVPVGPPLVAVHVRELRAGRGSSLMQMLQQALDDLTMRTDWHFVLVPMRYSPEHGTDQDAARQLKQMVMNSARLSVLEGECNSHEVRGIIGKCVAAIGMAYHFGVFSLSQGIPAVNLLSSVYYEGKVRGLYRHFQCEESVFDATQDPKAVSERLLSIYRDEQYRRTLLDCAEDWKHRSRQPIDAIERRLSTRRMSITSTRIAASL